MATIKTIKAVLEANADINTKFAVILEEGIVSVKVTDKEVRVVTNGDKAYYRLDKEMILTMEEMMKAEVKVGNGCLTAMDAVYTVCEGTDLGIDYSEEGIMKLFKKDGAMSAAYYETKVVEEVMVEEVTNNPEPPTKEKAMDKRKHVLGNEWDTFGLGDGVQTEAYCRNMYCDGRDKAVALKDVFGRRAVLFARIDKGQMMMKNLYTNIVKLFGNGVVYRRPEVIRGNDIVLRDSNIDTTGLIAVNMGSTRLVYTHYQDGNENYHTVNYFTNLFGMELGREKFAQFCVYRKKFESYRLLFGELCGAVGAMRTEIADVMAMEAVTPVVAAVPVYDEYGRRSWVCPHCGEEVRPFSSMNEKHFGVSKDSVEKELRLETYDFGDGRNVTINANGEIVKDTASDIMSETELDMICENIDVADLLVYNGDMSVFNEDEEFNPITEEYHPVYEASDYAASVVTQEDMDAFYELEGLTQEGVDRYNEVMKEHNQEKNWNKYRTGMTLVQAGWNLSYNNGDFFQAAGRMNSFFSYEDSVLRDMGITQDYSNTIAILTFNKLAGNAFDVSEYDLETLRHNEFSALLSSYNFEDWGVQDINSAKDTVKGAEKKEMERILNYKLLSNEYQEVMAKDESTWTEDDRETVYAWDMMNSNPLAAGDIELLD